MPEITGFIKDPLEPIRRLRNDLGDRYRPGIPILKELIQNADDAEATHVVLGLAPGFPDAAHPLLQGRALFLVNNGRFEAEHEYGIRLYGTSHKEADLAAVGKFGLGMKSVFHLCEAFFFLAGLPQGLIARIVNPWSDTKAHPSWGPPTPADAERMRASIAPAIRDLPSPFGNPPFILWLPLRRETHRWEDGQETGVIVSEFPGDEDRHLGFLAAPDLASRLADLMPLLRRVGQIRLLSLIEPGQPGFSVEVDANARRLSFREATPEHVLDGTIQVRTRESDVVETRFIGQETWRWTNDLQELKRNKHWPTHPTENERGVSGVEPEKALPHAAAVLTATPTRAGQGRLTVRWAVFLPLDDALVAETLECGADRDYCITLHGYFFVDAGRRGIHGFDVLGQGTIEAPVDSSDEVRVRWNRSLALKASLALLLPVLQRYVASLPVERRLDTGKHLTDALLKSAIWQRFAGEVGASGQWVLRVTRDGSSWEHLDAARDLIPLPSPPDRDPNRPWQVFPVLDSLEATHALVIAGAPQLSARPSPAPTQAQIENLLDSISVADAMARQTHVAYIAATLELCAKPEVLPLGVQRRLRGILRTAFTSVGLSGLRANRAEIKRLTGLLRPDSYLALPDSIPAPLLQQLAACDIATLILPADLAPRADADQAKLSLADAEQLLCAIADWITADASRGTSKPLLDQVPRLVRQVDQAARDALFRSLRDRPLIYAFEGRANEWRAVTPAAVDAARLSNLLFRQGQIGDDQGLGLARRFQATLATQRLLVLQWEVREMLGLSQTQVPVCDAKGVLHALGAQSQTLGEPATRRDLLRQLPDPGDDAASKRGLRFLMHGHEGRWSDLDTSLWYRDTQVGAAWERLWAELNEGWNLIDQGLAVCVLDDVRTLLGVKRISPADLLKAVSDQGTGRINPADYSAAECTAILREAREPVVWRMLPLHDCTDGSRRDALGNHVYLTTGLALPQGLKQPVRILSRDRDEAVARQQDQWLARFDAEARLRLVLASDRAEDFTDCILSDLVSLDTDLPNDLRDSLKQTAWIGDNRDGRYLPGDIIDCEDPSGLIHDLAAEAPAGTYSFVGLLKPEIHEHPGFERLRGLDLLAQGKDALATLGLLIGELPKYRLGQIGTNPQDLRKALPVLAGLPDHLGLPGWALLASLAQDHDLNLVLEHVAPAIAQQIDGELAAVFKLLVWIRDQGQADEARRTAFEIYLQRFAEVPQARDQLARLHLIDNGGHWRPAAELCAGGENIERRFVLCDSQQHILAGLVCAADSLPSLQGDGVTALVPVAGADLARLLEDYFRDWRDKVPTALIGCFVLLCGSAPEVKALVETYRGNRTAGLGEWLLAKLPWQVQGLRNDGTPGWLCGMGLEQAIDAMSFSALIASDNRVTVSSILGSPIVVERARNCSDFVTVLGRNTDVILQLVPIDVGGQSAAALEVLLKRSIQKLAKGWSGWQPLADAPIWTELQASDQIAIDVARALILENLPVLAKQLKSGHHPALEQALRAYDDARAQAVEFRGHPRSAELEKRKQTALEAMRALIEGDAGARSGLLEAVRDKIRDFQYRIDSIPFELFQNADDALYQRLEIEAYPGLPIAADGGSVQEYARFVVRRDPEALTFLHWGRPINAVGDPFPGRDRWFHRDLENMLILNASGKEQPATGKFGLGFKSVFLACDRPQLVSGRLSAEILGGMLPKQLGDDTHLRDLLRGQESGNAGTAIQIDVDEQRHALVLDRFCNLAGVLCCFAKAIRRIDLAGEPYAWEPTALPGIPRLSTGRVRMPLTLKPGGLAWRRALRLDLGEGALLVGLGGSGVEPLPDPVPTFWSMAPTDEKDALGFALNGPFAVDAGRTQLANAPGANHEIADRLGRGLYAVLEYLTQGIDADWSTIHDGLDLTLGCEPYDLWSSLWETLLGRLQVPQQMGRRDLTLRVMREGLGALASVRPIIPNGLPSGQRGLLRTGDVRLVLRGALTIDAVLETLCPWDRFASELKPGATVQEQTHEQLALVDPRHGSARGRWTSKQLKDFVVLLMDGGQQVVIRPDDATIWETVLAFSAGQALTKDQSEDLETTQQQFKGALFRNAQAALAPAADLLDPNTDIEERRRWAFAPDNQRLSTDYCEAGRMLLRRCRPGGYSANPQRMADWIRGLPEDFERRTAALIYLRDGDQAKSTLALLRERDLEGTWLANLSENSPYLMGWSHEDALRLLVELESLDRLEQMCTTFLSAAVKPVPTVDVKATLHEIAKWWSRARVDQIVQYERQVYPGGSAPSDALRIEIEDGTGNRPAWLTLFLLGHFHTIGLRPEQHRRFIQMCQDQGWWADAFTRPDPQKIPDVWMGVLDKYIEVHFDDEIYQYWMRSFPVIYRFARYLDEYRELMLKLPLWGWEDGVCRIEQLTISSRADSLSGGGETAAACKRALGSGVNFVVRELLRLGIVVGDHLPNACAYVPTKGVRDLFARWGFAEFEGSDANPELSPLIYRILCEQLGPEAARFGGDYDLPLQRIAYDPGLEGQCTVYRP